MKLVRLLPLLLMLTVLSMGCSDDSLGPTGDNNNTNPAITTTDNGDGTFTTVVDAGYLDADHYVYLSFATGEETTPDTPENSADWDMAFKFANILVNGGANGTGGVGIVAYDDAGFAGLTAAPNAVYLTDSGEDDPGQCFNTGQGWYTYSGPPDHDFSINADRYYVLRLTDGSYIKFQMTAFVDGAGTPGYPTFTWAPIAGDFPVMTAQVGNIEYQTLVAATSPSAWVYFSFGSGLEATPANPADSDEYDLAFSYASVALNGGTNGTGGVEVMAMDDAGYDALTQAPAGSYATDGASDLAFDVAGGWYTYSGPPDHIFSINPDRYYVVHAVDGNYYKLRMTTFRNPAGDAGYPGFEWDMVDPPLQP